MPYLPVSIEKRSNLSREIMTLHLIVSCPTLGHDALGNGHLAPNHIVGEIAEDQGDEWRALADGAPARPPAAR